MERRKSLTPAAIDALASGALLDPLTLGLSVEMLRSGKKVWKYRRRLPNAAGVVKLTLGGFPAHSIAEARVWANRLNEQVEVGIDPRVAAQKASDRAKMTVAFAHGLYMTAVREGRASRAKRVNKTRTIADKQAIYDCDIGPKLGARIIYDVIETDLTKVVLAKGKVAPVRANRLATELKIFFGWASSLRGTEVGLETNPAHRLTDLRFAETPRTRRFSAEEIGWFLLALTHEPRTYQRALLLLLLTAARLSEVVGARSDELDGDVWTIPEDRAKNSRAHRVALAPWGLSLFRTNARWVFPSSRIDGHQVPSGFYKARNRVLARMAHYAGQPVDNWTPHDMRRTARSNTKRLNVDFETAEAMLNHAKRGLQRTYDGYELEEEKREWFLKWETEIATIACKVGVAEALGVPNLPAPAAMLSPVPWRRRAATRGRAFLTGPARRRP